MEAADSTTTGHLAPRSAGRELAIIGSFRQHYNHVRAAISAAAQYDWTVTSPLGHDIVEPGIDFVRFDSDSADFDDPTVQSVALHRILRADLVYVVAPGGYVGRTTCYEIGRIVGGGRPLYFSERPADLPIAVPDAAIGPLDQLLSSVRTEPVQAWWGQSGAANDSWERRLLDSDYDPYI